MLGFSSGLPISLVTSSLQAWFADAGLSVQATGFLSLIGLPYLLRFLWAPLLDKYRLFSLGKRRSWILTMQLLIAVGLFFISGLNPQQSSLLMMLVALAIASFSATQDAAIDAHRTEYLDPPLHGLGASFAMFAYRMALLVSGGMVLVLAQHFGWALSYRLMGLLMIMGVIGILISPEPSQYSARDQAGLPEFIEPLRQLFVRKQSLIFFAFVLLYKLGTVFTSSVSGIVMPFFIQGLHFSLQTIGYVIKVWGLIAMILGGLLAGVVLIRCSLYRALLAFGLLQALTNGFFILLASCKPNLGLLILSVFSDNFATGMGATAMVVLFMRYVNQHYTAIQYSVLVAISGITLVLSGPVGALLQKNLGWVGLYILAFILSFAFIPFQLRQHPMFQIK